MNRLSNEDRCRVLACLVEGNSIRSTTRITGICKRTNQNVIWATHPRTGDQIVNVNDNGVGIQADLITKAGRVRLAGTWAFAPGLSFSVLDEHTATMCGISPGYVYISGAWQY